MDYLIIFVIAGAILYFFAKTGSSIVRSGAWGQRIQRKAETYSMHMEEAQSKKLMDGFLCKKCGMRSAELNIFATPLKDSSAATFNLDNTQWIELACQKCAASEIYNYHFVVKDNTEEFLRKNPVQEQCAKCKEAGLFSIPIVVTGPGLSARLDVHQGEYDTKCCSQCGFAEIYEILESQATSGGMRLLHEISKLVRKFKCPKCSQSKGHAAVVTAVSNPAGKFLNLQNAEFIFITCDECKFTEAYNREIRAGSNLFAKFR